MKKAILVAASLFTTASAVTTGEAVKANPNFVLSQSTAGNLVFTGVGTAQYNNSIGTNNSFQVGSSTNLGVNASTSSTPEYEVTSHARLDLASNSNLSQVIGTSGASNTLSAETKAAMDKADTTAQTRATEAGIQKQKDFELAFGVDFDTWDKGGKTGTLLGVDSSGWTDSADFEAAKSKARSITEESTYNSTYESTYKTLSSNITTTTDTSSANGIIQGTFTTKEFGEATSGATMGDWRSASAKAGNDAANLAYEANWSAYVSKNGDTSSAANLFRDDANWVTSDEASSNFVAGLQSAEEKYEDARGDAYSTAYNKAYADALTKSSRTSESDVKVLGIGSDASVTSKSSSTFDVLIGSTVGNGFVTKAESTATATGAAGANLSTSSFANQSNANTASAFMQAFGGDAETTAAALTDIARKGYISESDIDRAMATSSGDENYYDGSSAADLAQWVIDNPATKK
jgi:hypothetical protein